jgi:hypothetical protein
MIPMTTVSLELYPYKKGFKLPETAELILVIYCPDFGDKDRVRGLFCLKEQKIIKNKAFSPLLPTLSAIKKQWLMAVIQMEIDKLNKKDYSKRLFFFKFLWILSSFVLYLQQTIKQLKT